MESEDAGYLMLSGLKHFRFCRRRWALVHIEQQWGENSLTLEGHFMHQRVHDSHFTQSRGSVLLSRGMRVRSAALQLTGECDLVELHRDENGIPIHGRDGTWRLYPVEYKHGSPDARGADALQLCAQAMCLEEMFVTHIPEGALFYGKTRRRQAVAFTPALREQVRQCAAEMQALFRRGHTPRAKYTAACRSCSLYELCQPGLTKHRSASAYLSAAFEEDGKA